MLNFIKKALADVVRNSVCEALAPIQTQLKSIGERVDALDSAQEPAEFFHAECGGLYSALSEEDHIKIKTLAKGEGIEFKPLDQRLFSRD